MVWQEVVFVGGIALVVGMVMAFLLMRFTKLFKFVDKEEKEKQKVLRDPDLLVQKLNEGRSMNVDDGEVMEYSVKDLGGKRVVDLKIYPVENGIRMPLNVPEPKIIEQEPLQEAVSSVLSTPPTPVQAPPVPVPTPMVKPLPVEIIPQEVVKEEVIKEKEVKKVVKKEVKKETMYTEGEWLKKMEGLMKSNQ